MSDTVNMANVSVEIDNSDKAKKYQESGGNRIVVCTLQKC